MNNLYIQTPLIESVPLSQSTGKSVWLKMEALQPSGSFKNRGIGYLCQESKKQGSRLFICSSGGNAGLAAAYSGRRLSIPVQVVIPKTTPQTMIEKLQAEGAMVTIHGDNWNEADDLARKLCSELNATYISPFDHPLIWKGHSSIIEEIKQSGFKPEAILLSVGGGGLYCGVVQGLKEAGWGDVAVVAVETKGASSFYQSVHSKKLVTLNHIDTIATTLGARRVSDQAFEYAKTHPTYSEIVTDQESLRACFQFLKDHRILVEPSCGASLSLLYQNHPILKKYKNIVSIVCGGNGVNLNLLKTWSDQLGVQFNDYL